MSGRRTRASGWPYAVAAVVLAPALAWVVFAHGDDVSQLKLPTSTTIGVAEPVPSTSSGTSTTTPSTSATSPSTSAPESSTTEAASTTTGASASQAPVPTAGSEALEPSVRRAAITVHGADAISAAVLAARLQGSGWSTISHAAVPHDGSTRVIVRPGFEAAGQLILTDLGINGTVQIADGLTPLDPRHDPDVLLIVGSAAAQP